MSLVANSTNKFWKKSRMNIWKEVNLVEVLIQVQIIKKEVYIKEGIIIVETRKCRKANQAKNIKT